jgi:hypothetical protein
MARERVLADPEYFRGLADSEREPRQTCVARLGPANRATSVLGV